MARTIHGKITNQNNKPVKNVKIEAWDADSPDADDRMGVVYTDANGNYELHYRKMDWDTDVFWSPSSWRPDIYITAKIKNNNGNWMRAAKSKTYKNHKLKKDRRIDLKINFAPVVKKRTGFKVSQYAFQFKNSFVVRNLIPTIPGVFHMGFCGGMCAGALHRFNHKCSVPRQATTPRSGSPLYKELFQRQVDTLMGGVILKIYDWMRSPDLPHTFTPHSIRFRQKGEWKILRAYLDQGKPMILCLIREEGYLADITKNHQVLAIGYEYDPTPRDLKVEIYDPNDKKGSNYLILSLSGGRLGAHQITSQGARINFRGFFVVSTTAEASKKHYV